MRPIALVALAATPVRLVAAEASGPVALGWPSQRPAALGFSPTGLDRVEKFVRGEIAAKHYAGAVWLVARDGKIAAHGASGLRDVEGKLPMTEDTIFRIFSMTKPVTVVAVMTLIEEGRLNLDDPVSRYLPALAKPLVFVGGTADAPQLVAAERPITIRHLLTHTSGYPYDIFAPQPLKTLWDRVGIWESASVDEFVAKVAKLPLLHQPGKRWTYGINIDLLAAVVSKITGQPLGEVMRTRIFEPLRMKDTAFRVPAAAWPRLAKAYRRTGDGGFALENPVRPLVNEGGAVRSGTFDEGGGGLFSTVSDYARFAQMLLNGGELDGVRVLGRKSVELMSRNHVTHLPPTDDPWTPAGFGFGVSVQVEGAYAAGSLGSPGQYGWQGYATTYFTVDPRERMIALLLVQHQPYNENGLFERFANTVYGALAK
jgi:CubicO group peptidase (beta-lactamase class C family)